jgi:hypothetical protein
MLAGFWQANFRKTVLEVSMVKLVGGVSVGITNFK